MSFDFDSILTGEAIFSSMNDAAFEKEKEDYIGRGRLFAKLDIETLNRDWVEAGRKWTEGVIALMRLPLPQDADDAQLKAGCEHHKESDRLYRRRQDLCAEFSLRGLDPPMDRVSAETQTLAQIVAGRAELLERALERSLEEWANPEAAERRRLLIEALCASNSGQDDAFHALLQRLYPEHSKEAALSAFMREGEENFRSPGSK
jgi:hypothetical protein